MQSHMESITCPDAIPSQWSSLPPQSHESLAIRKLTWVDTQIQVPSLAVSQQWENLTTKYVPFQVLLLKLFYLVLVIGSIPQKGKKVVALVPSLGLWKAPNVTSHLSQASILTMDSSTVLCSLHPTQLTGFDTKGWHIQNSEVET